MPIDVDFDKKNELYIIQERQVLERKDTISFEVKTWVLVYQFFPNLDLLLYRDNN